MLFISVEMCGSKLVNKRFILQWTYLSNTGRFEEDIKLNMY